MLQQLSVYWRNPLFQPKRTCPNSSNRYRSNQNIHSLPVDPEAQEGTVLSSLMNPGKLSVLLLHKLSDELRFVLIVALMRRIMQARLETSELEKTLRINPDLSAEEISTIENRISRGIPPSWIIADEAQNFLPSERKTTATDVLVRLVREGRNFGLSFVLTTQQPSAIDQRILAQVDTLIAHKLTMQADIDYVKRKRVCQT